MTRSSCALRAGKLFPAPCVSDKRRLTHQPAHLPWRPLLQPVALIAAIGDQLCYRSGPWLT